VKLLIGILHGILFLVFLGLYWHLLPFWQTTVTSSFVNFIVQYEWSKDAFWLVDGLYILLATVDFSIASFLSATVIGFGVKKLNWSSKLGLLVYFCPILVIVIFDYFSQFIGRYTGSNFEYLWYLAIPSLVLYLLIKKPNNQMQPTPNSYSTD
jgi:hypothetical protein|tara:strand:+ start:82 stop:540 length:459 start_codon:yes stop_codon:yes gene_type:complete